MDFSWSDEHLVFKENVNKFAKNELNSAKIERDHDCLFEKNYGRNVLDLAYRASASPRDMASRAGMCLPLSWCCKSVTNNSAIGIKRPLECDLIS